MNPRLATFLFVFLGVFGVAFAILEAAVHFFAYWHIAFGSCPR